MLQQIEKNWIHSSMLEIRWEARIDQSILIAQRNIYLNFKADNTIKELRMGFHTLCILFKKQLSAQEQSHWEEKIDSLPTLSLNLPNARWEIPVCYELGKDLEALAKAKNVEAEKIIELHSKNSYLIHFYGFLPGFMYLGGLDSFLHTNRKFIPDPIIEAGSVGIGGAQTGIYPINSPGGWHIIGKTPLRLFDINLTPPVLPQIGDSITFSTISLSEYHKLEQLIKTKSYSFQPILSDGTT